MKWWDKLSNIGLTGGEDIQQVRHVHILNRILFLGCFFNDIYLPVLIGLHNYFYVVVQTVFAVLLPVSFWFSHKKWFRLAAYYATTLLITNLSFAVIANNNIGAEYLMIPGSLSAFVVFKRKTDSLIMLFIFIIFWTIAEILTRYITPFMVLEENMRIGFYYFNILMGFIVSGAIIINFKNVVEDYEVTMLRQKAQIEEHNKEVTDSINYARRIQYTLLAHDAFLRKNLPEYFVLFRPKDIVSGDFYWAAQKENRFYLAVCDSTGHGVPGAFMSLLNISFLNEAISEKNIEAPNEVLNYVRKRLIETISQEGGQDGMDGALLCFENGTITYAAAHNAPIVIRNGKTIDQPADKMPVGKGESTDGFTTHSLELRKGDSLYLFTDGYADQFGGPKGKKYKYRQLEEKLSGISDKSLADQKNLLEKTFIDWKGELEQVDDVLVIGIRI